MTHLTLPRFWEHYAQLPAPVQELGDKNYQLLKADPSHASLHFKRVGEHYRALGSEKAEGIVWFWIGTHAEYDRLIAA